jgi:hypothetical protein
VVHGATTQRGCLFTGVGFRHPVPGSFVNDKIPEAVAVGFIGRPDGAPTRERSPTETDGDSTPRGGVGRIPGKLAIKSS